MFLITNRDVDESKKGPDAFGKKPNREGPNELRCAEATLTGGKWRVDILADLCTPAMLASAGIQTPGPHPASRYVAHKLLLRLKARLKKEGKPPALAFFVHGYNNDVEAVLERAQGFEELYGVEVVVFTWPANGGGGLGGVASYLSDKRDALASVGAFDRAILKLDGYLKEMNEAQRTLVEAEAHDAYAHDADAWDVHFARAMMRACPFTVNLVLHSMGNYVFKHYMGSSTFSGNRLVFDNVVLAAADTNNPGHAEWLDRVQCRRRVYVTINENDIALRASRMKTGEEQKARLGHYPYDLASRRAVYVDFTRARGVGDSHAYFEGKPVTKNAAVREFFRRALNGEVAEERLTYDVARNLYRVP
jgi:esterase/lipase superfamily enzyme